MGFLNFRFLCIFIGTVFFISPAYAYLDPGTGSMLLQGLIGGIAAGITVLSLYWQKIKSFFSRDKSKSEDEN